MGSAISTTNMPAEEEPHTDQTMETLPTQEPKLSIPKTRNIAHITVSLFLRKQA
jgi:hypothetical protein